MMSDSIAYDLAIIGGGIIGLATAREALRRSPDLRIVVLEKEPQIASHQSGHNSGVLHAGIYYKPGSLKARACVKGRSEMIQYCDEHHIPYKLCGKLIVALDESEIPRLRDLHQRGIANNVPDLEWVGQERIKEIEPYCNGVAALWSPHTGIIKFPSVAQSYAAEIRSGGGEILSGQRVEHISARQDGVILTTAEGIEITSKYVIACAGLQADRVARLEGAMLDVQIIPFRGDYYTFTADARHMVNGLIYPVPDPTFPWLGVHFTRVMSGDVWAGPNAVLAWSREGYRRTDLNVGDLVEALRYPGFLRLARSYWQRGLEEMLRDYVKTLYVQALQRYIPDLRSEQLIFGPSGVRAQALDAQGSLIDDFLIVCRGRIAHVLNAPSPAATSSLVISRMIVEQVAEWFAPV